MEQGTIERVCQLPPLQHGVLFEALRQHGSRRMLYQAHLDLAGPVRPELLRRSWREVVRRHTSLRSSFHYERLDSPVQVVRRDADPGWQELDWRDESDQDGRLAELLTADRERPFELTRAPLLRLALVRVAEERSWLVWTLHPLLTDGWSFYLVLADVFACYRELAAGREPAFPAPRPHWEYVSWLRQRGMGDAEDFWRATLKGLPTPVPLGDAQVPSVAPDAAHEEVPVAVPDGVRTALGTLTRACRVTLGTIVHAAWGVALSRYCGLDDVVFGGIVSGRDPAFDHVDDLVGMFTNNLPVRATVSGDRVLADWLVEFQQRLGDARQYDHVPLSTAQRCSPLPHDVPLFESMVDFCNYPVREQWTEAGVLQVTDVRLLESPPYPLSLVGVGGDQGWRLFLSYDPARFTAATAAGLSELFADVLAAMAARPHQRLSELPGWTGAAPSAPRAVVAPPEPAQAAARGRFGDTLDDMVAAVWAQALELPADQPPAETGNFFELGGHSLVAIRLVSRLRAVFDVDFTIGHLFADPTVGGSARAVAALLSGGDGAGLDAIPRLPRNVPLPASFAQERLWFVDQLDEDAPANNLVVSHRVPRDLDAGAMRAALARLADRHEVLRTCLREQDGVVVQVVLAEASVPLATDDLSGLPTEDARTRARTLLEQDAARRFDLAADVPVRARLVRLAPGDTVLGICLHHIAYDGWSADVLAGDLAELYEAEVAGRPPELPPLPVQYADFSGWQRARFADPADSPDADYWRTQLAGLPGELRLGTPAERAPETRTGAAGRVSRRLADDVAPGLRALAGAEAVTPYMVLLAAFAVLVGRHSGKDEAVVGTPVADREHPDLEPLIGLFVNTQVLRLPVRGEPTFRELVHRVRRVCLDAMAHRDLPFAQLVRVVSPDRVADRMPLAQLEFTMNTGAIRPLRLAGADADYFPTHWGVPRTELTAEVYDLPDGMSCAFHHAEDVYRRDFVERLLDEYADLVQALVAAPDRPVTASLAGDLDTAMGDSSRALLRALSGR